MKTIQLTNSLFPLLTQLGGFSAIYYRNLNCFDDFYSLNENVQFHSASIYKIFILAEILRHDFYGLLSINDKLTLKNSFKSIVDGSTYNLNVNSDSDKFLYEKIGYEVTIEELAKRMIILSSNLATNNLIEIISAKNVQRTLELLGLMDTKIFRGVEDEKAFKLGMNNITTVKDTAKILEIAAEGKLFSHSVSKKFIEILSEQTIRKLIPRYLPDDLKIANKTGEITGHRHDAALIFSDDKPAYIFVIFTRDLKPENIEQSEEVISKISLEIYNHYSEYKCSQV